MEKESENIKTPLVLQHCKARILLATNFTTLGIIKSIKR